MPLRRTLTLALAALALAAPAALGQTQTQTPPPDERPAARQRLYAVVYRAGPSWLPDTPMASQPGMREHFLHIRDLHARGVVVAAGPWGEDGGLVLLRAVSLARARDLTAADPAVATGLFTGEVRVFDPRFGTIP